MSVKNKFMLESGRAVLLVIDVQEKLCAAMDANVLAQLTRNTGILLESARELSVPVIITEQYVKGLGQTQPELRGKVPDAPQQGQLASCHGNDDTGGCSADLHGVGGVSVIEDRRDRVVQEAVATGQVIN